VFTGGWLTCRTLTELLASFEITTVERSGVIAIASGVAPVGVVDACAGVASELSMTLTVLEPELVTNTFCNDGTATTP
jgi:hypothetical protein